MMRGPGRNPLAFLGIAALAAMIAGCSNPLSNLQINPLPRVDQIAKPDWLTYSGGQDHFTLRPVRPQDLVGRDGRCAMTAEEAKAMQAAELAARQQRAAGAPRESDPEPQPPLMQGGISLQMTECDVIRRAGAPEGLEFGTGERGERMVVITYVRGVRPGVYRFAGGRLYSIERAPAPPPPPESEPKATPKKKRAAPRA
jgi:hypothetical protein